MDEGAAPEQGALPPSQPSPAGGEGLAPKTGDESVGDRLGRVIAVGLAVLEQRFEEGDVTLAHTRTLTELCRAEEIRMRSMRSEKAGKAREKKNKNGGPDYRNDPDWLLSEINRRLDRLSRRGAGGSGNDPEGDAEGGGAARR